MAERRNISKRYAPRCDTDQTSVSETDPSPERKRRVLAPRVHARESVGVTTETGYCPLLTIDPLLSFSLSRPGPAGVAERNVGRVQFLAGPETRWGGKQHEHKKRGWKS